MRIVNVIQLAVVLSCGLFTMTVLGDLHKHEQPGYWDDFLKSLGPAASAFLANDEVQNVLKMLNSLHEKFDTKDIEDHLEAFTRMDFGALSALNLGFEDFSGYLSKGMSVLAENPILIELLSNYLKEAGFIPRQSNAVQEFFKVLYNLYNSDQVPILMTSIMSEIQKSMANQKVNPAKEGRFHFTTLRALGDAAIRLSGLRGEYNAIETFESLVNVMETFMDYLHFVYESVSNARAAGNGTVAEQHDHKVSLMVAIVRDILITPQEKLHHALRDADSIADDLQALEFVADRFRPAGGRSQSFAHLTEEINNLANEMRLSKQAALAMDEAFDKLDDGLVEKVLMLKPHLDKLSRDLRIGAKSLVTLKPAENLERPKRRNVEQLVPLVHDMSEEVAHAVLKISQLYEVAKRVEHVTDVDSFVLFLTKLRNLLVDTPKFVHLIAATDSLYDHIGQMIESTRSMDEL